MSEETKKNLTEFDHYLIHAAIEQYDQKKYDSVTVDTLTKYAPYDVSAACALQMYTSLAVEILNKITKRLTTGSRLLLI